MPADKSSKQEPREKRRLLNFVLSNCTWDDGEVVALSVNLLIYLRKPRLTLPTLGGR